MSQLDTVADLAGLGKVGIRLIEKISDATGVVYEPTRITRRAKAEAKAEIMRAKADVEVADIQRRAAQRFISEQTLMQANMEEIIEKASSRISEDASPEDVGNDWLLNFFDKSRLVSEDEMQDLWARVLAGEANNPGSYSRKTVNILVDLEAEDARLFNYLSNFRLTPGYVTRQDVVDAEVMSHFVATNDSFLVVLDKNHSVYTGHGFNYISIGRLEWLGLVRSTPGYTISLNTDKYYPFAYSGGLIFLLSERPVSFGNVEFTVAGKQLSRLCTPSETPPEGFIDYVTEVWRNEGVRVCHNFPR